MKIHASWGSMAAISLWLAAVGFGMALLISHAKTPGLVGKPHETWPPEANLQRTPGVCSLLVFLLPECPCSRATVAELGRVLAKNQRPVQVVACLAQWEPAVAENSLTTSIQSIPGVRSVPDADGKIAKRFGAMTSGTVALYSENGALLFFGGITGARGHEGDNPGRDNLARLLQDQPGDNIRSEVYGCSLF